MVKHISKIAHGSDVYYVKDVEAREALIDKTEKGAANGVAELDSTGKVPSSQLPGYDDFVLEYENKSSFPSTGEAGKIYIDKATNLLWRWNGTTYAEISPSVVLSVGGQTGTVTAALIGTALTNAGYKLTDKDTTYTFAGGTNKITVTPSGGTAQDITVTPSISKNVTGAAAWTAADIITTTNAASGNVIKASGKSLTNTTPSASSDDTTIPTSKAVWSAVSNGIATADAMVYKGTIAGGSTGAYGALTVAANKGDTYKVTTAGKVDGVAVEVGDMIICNTDSTAAATSSNYSTIAAKWDFIQANIDGAVTGPASSTDAHIAVFNGTTGKVIKDSGFTIGKSVPSNAVFTDTVYSLPTASASTLGGIKVGTNLSISSGVLSASDSKVTSTLTEPNSTTDYYPLLSDAITTNTKGAIKTDGFKFRTRCGTTDLVGQADLWIGNPVAEGSESNKTGKLYLYNNKGKYASISSHANDTSDRTIYTPKGDGTLVAHATDTAIGSSTLPVYISANGFANAIDYTIEKSVPSNAKFTDTTYSAGTTALLTDGTNTTNRVWPAKQIADYVTGLGYITKADVMTGATSSAAGIAGVVPAPAKGKLTSFLRGDGTWAVPTDTNTTYSAGTGLSLSGTTFSLALTKALVTNALGYTPPTTNTTYSNMTGATADAAGSAGLVPAPAKGKQTSFLRGDGTWVIPTNTTYSAFTGATVSAAGAAGLVPAPEKRAAYGGGRLLFDNGTWDTPYKSYAQYKTNAAHWQTFGYCPTAGGICTHFNGILHGLGKYSAAVQGVYLIEFYKYSATVCSLTVTCLQLPSSILGLTFGYYDDGTNTYFGYTCATGHRDLQLTPISTYNVTLADSGILTAAPTGWTAGTFIGALTVRLIKLAPTSSETYYPLFTPSNSTTTQGTYMNPTGFSVSVLLGAAATDTTAAVEGRAFLYLGNTIASTANNNQTGGICLYNNQGKYFGLWPHVGTTSNRNLYLPDANGTLVAHTSDTAIGSSKLPVYISASGVATAIGYTIEANVPSNAKFTDTTYSSKTAVDGGMDLSLLTTGEKYNLLYHLHLEDVADTNTSTLRLLLGAASSGTISATAFKNSRLTYKPSTKTLSVNNISFGATDTYNIGTSSVGAKCIYSYWLGAPDGCDLKIAANDAGNHIYIKTDGKVGVGTNSPSYLLHVNGACAASSFPNTSDIRLKNILEDFEISTEDIANAPIFKYTWKDSENDTSVHIGSSAQYWKEKIPEVVTTADDEIGTLAMQYDVIALASVLKLANEIIDLKKQIEDLKSEITSMKSSLYETKPEYKELTEGVIDEIVGEPEISEPENSINQ